MLSSYSIKRYHTNERTLFILRGVISASVLMWYWCCVHGLGTEHASKPRSVVMNFNKTKASLHNLQAYFCKLVYRKKNKKNPIKICLSLLTSFPAFNTLRRRQNERHFADDVFKCIFLNDNVWISLNISPKFVPKGPINNIPALVQIIVWRRSGNKPLSEPMIVSLPTHTCVTRPQWVDFIRTWYWVGICWWIYTCSEMFIRFPNVTDC